MRRRIREEIYHGILNNSHAKFLLDEKFTNDCNNPIQGSEFKSQQLGRSPLFVLAYELLC